MTPETTSNTNNISSAGLHRLDQRQRSSGTSEEVDVRQGQNALGSLLLSTGLTPSHRTLPVVSDFDLPAAPHHLVVPRHRRSTLGRRAVSVAGPMALNALPDDLRDPSLSADNFRKKLKTHLFRNALGHLAH